MNKVYLHLGLHKTATTSLKRSVFQKLDFQYLGRRYESKYPPPLHELYTRITSYCFSQEANEENSLIRGDICKILERGDILLSEEWFTSDYCGPLGFQSASWQSRIQRLGELFSGLPVELLITTREPVDALHSLYCELFNLGLSVKYTSAFEFAINSNDSLAYDLKYLEHVLLNTFDATPLYLSLEQLSLDPNYYRLQLQKWLAVESIPSIDHCNRSSLVKGGRVVYVDDLSVKISKVVFKFVPSVIKRQLGRGFKSRLKNLLFGSGTKVYIKGFTDQEILQIKNKYNSNESSGQFEKMGA